MEKVIIVKFPDDFKFPEHYGDKNIVKPLCSMSACDDCPFSYDSIACRISEDKSDGPWKCPLYDSDKVTITVN